MDGVLSHNFRGRVFAITTNDVKALDEPLKRSGRMDLNLEFSYLTIETFASLAQIYCNEKESSVVAEFQDLPWEKIRLSPADAIHLIKGGRWQNESRHDWKAAVREHFSKHALDTADKSRVVCRLYTV